MGRDPTAESILAAGLRTFGTAGFKATTLSKVALVAGVSRPTLYARHPDKVHLFRAVIEQTYVDASTNAAIAAAADGPFSDILSRVLLEYYGGLFDRFHGLPQIDELTLTQLEHAQDIVAEARQRMKRLLSELLRAWVRDTELDARALDVSIPQLVELLRLAPLSLKEANTTRSQYRMRLRSLARLVATSLGANSKDRPQAVSIAG